MSATAGIIVDQLRRESAVAPAYMLVPAGGSGPAQLIKVNLAGTIPPTISDDTTQGYSPGSMWVVTAVGQEAVYFCLDATTGAAKWQQGTNQAGEQSGSERPIRIFLGHLMSYPFQASMNPSSQIQYTRVFIAAGIVIDNMETFYDQVNGSPKMRMALYDQTDVTNPNLEPNAKIAETAEVSLVGGDAGVYKVVPVLANYTVPTSGWYWIAIVNDSTQPKMAASDNFRAGYLPRREASSTGTILPGTAVGLSNPQSSCVYAAAVVQ